MRHRFRLLKSGIIIGAVLLLLLACSSNDYSYDDLKGNWVSIKASRNGKQTQTLENVFFRFTVDSLLKTNLFGKDEAFNIQFNQAEIIIQSSKIKSIFVKSLVADTLIISSKINEFRFDFELIKRDQHTE